MGMAATINHKNLTIGFRIGDEYNRIQLIHDGDHLHLPFAFKLAEDHSAGRQKQPRKPRNHLSNRAVSYTHLTLPTIYSV